LRHDLRVEGPAFALRPVVVEDSELIVRLRTDAERTRYMHAVPNDVGAQQQWLTRYFERPGDYYFAVVRRSSGSVEGFVGIYDVKVEGSERIAEWGRWILRRGSLAAAESALLTYRTAFELLTLTKVFSRTLPENVGVVSFHDNSSLSERRVVRGAVELDGMAHDAVEHVLTVSDFPRVRAVLEPLVTRLANRLNAGAR
jgi:RimJ/RimL family protein N-acetyltransferase